MHQNRKYLAYKQHKKFFERLSNQLEKHYIMLDEKLC